MLDDVHSNEGQMVVFQDLNGEVWQLAKREDLKDLDSLVEVDPCYNETSGAVSVNMIDLQPKSVIKMTGLDQIAEKIVA